MDETNSYKKLKKVNSVLPNIKYNYTDIKYSGEKNNSNFNKEDYKELKNNLNIEEKNQNNDFNYISNTHSYSNDNNTLKKYNSQLNLFNNNYNISSTQSDEEDFSNFFGKIKIHNFFSSAEIIVLIENILNDLNFKKNYSFTIKDSLITFSFGDANKALAVFKRLNMEKLNNNYYRNLIIDINLDIKNNHNKLKENYQIKEELNMVSKREIYKKILPNKYKINEIKDINKFQNIKPYNLTKDSVSDKNFVGIYKNYLKYFEKRREERRKKELSYVNGKNYSLQASTPYVDYDNRNYFQESLRKYEGKKISPADFNGYIKASITPI
jgi:hypothetical protein